MVLGECKRIDRVIDRLFVSLGPGLEAEVESAQVRVGAVTVDSFARVAEFDELTRAAHEALASLPISGTRLWAGRSLRPQARHARAN